MTYYDILGFFSLILDDSCMDGFASINRVGTCQRAFNHDDLAAWVNQICVVSYLLSSPTFVTQAEEVQERRKSTQARDLLQQLGHARTCY